MEDTTERPRQFPDDAIEHFKGYLENVRKSVEDKRDDPLWWGGWVFQFKTEFDDATSRDLLSEEVKDINEEVESFFENSENRKAFSKAKKYFEEKGTGMENWWEEGK